VRVEQASIGIQVRISGDRTGAHSYSSRSMECSILTYKDFVEVERSGATDSSSNDGPVYQPAPGGALKRLPPLPLYRLKRCSSAGGAVPIEERQVCDWSKLFWAMCVMDRYAGRMAVKAYPEGDGIAAVAEWVCRRA
jgi:hypothetical protein